MTRETKIGLLLGLGVILLIGIIISDQLSQVQQGDPADFTGFAAESQRSIDASDAAPTPAPGYAPAYAPAGVPADNSTLTDVPGNFFIPDDVRATLPRQAEATPDEGAGTAQPLAAYNVSQNSAPVTAAPETDVPTVTIGAATPKPPAYIQPVPVPVESADAHQIVPGSAGTPVIRHTVLQGESLIKIARRYYGDGEYWRAIALANPGTVSPEGSVNSGAVLNIPKRDDATLGLEIASTSVETARPVTSRTAARSATVEIESGDTLSELAARHLGSAARWDELLEANKDQLDSPESLRVGMKLRLPVTTGGATASATTTRPAAGSATTYEVRPGDNLTEIAEKMLGDGDKWRVVYEANRDMLQSPDRLVVGQELRIPG